MDKVLNECKAALAALAPLWKFEPLEELVVSSQKTLYSKLPRDGGLYAVKEGTLKCVKDDRVLYYVEEGDIIGFEGSAYDESMDFHAEFAVALVKLDPKMFLSSDETIQLWNRFQGNFLNAILQSVSHNAKSDSLFSPEVRSFAANEIILEQGTAGDEVYSLIDGLAETIVDGKVVGDILPDQLFGAVSLLTNSARIATVRALTDCMVVVLSKEQFLSLIESKPDTLLRLAEDLSKAIVALNQEVTGLVRIA